MSARSRGTVVVIAVGLVLAVAVPAAAHARTAPARQIVTAVAQRSSITMRSGFSQYFYVGSSSTDAQMNDSSFGYGDRFACATPGLRRSTETPIGHSTSDEASFSSTGLTSGIAGVGISGYSWKRTAQGGSCANGPVLAPAPLTGNAFLFRPNKNVAGTYLVLVGTLGITSLSASLYGACSADGGVVKTLQNVTYQADSNVPTSVGVFLATVPADGACNSVGLSGTMADGGTFGFYPESFLLTAKRTS